MAEDAVGVVDNAAGAGIGEVRTRSRTIGGGTKHEQYVIPVSDRVIAGEWVSSSFRIPARALAAQTLAAVFVGASSAQFLVIRDILVDQETIAIKTVINPLLKVQKTSVVHTNGTAGTKNLTDSNDATDANITVAFDASADGTNSASALTNGTLTGAAFQPRYATRMHTAVGISISGSDPLQHMRGLPENKPMVLRPSQGLVLQMSAAAALVAGDWHWAVTIIGEEFTLP